MSRLRSSEHRLLLACARRGTGSAEIQTLLRSDLDWDGILGDAELYRVAPLVYQTLRPIADHTAVPATAMARLKELYYRQAAMNANLYGELRKILTALSREAIPAIVLKGAAMAEPVYRNIALRPMQDLDLLVRRNDLEAADKVVRGLGYVPDDSYRSTTWYRDHHHHLAPYAAGDGRTVVEVHQHILPPAAAVRPPIEELWRRARPVWIASVPTFILAPEDLLLHLCLDVSCVDRFVGKLGSLCDIAAATEHYGNEIDWGQLLGTARDYEAERFVYYPLWLARRVVEAEIPPMVLRALESSIRRPSLEDLSLKVLTRRAVLAHRRDTSPLPAWIMARTCGDLMSARGSWGIIKAMRPLDLLARAVARVARRRDSRGRAVRGHAVALDGASVRRHCG